MIPDYTSEVKGSASANDGNAIAMVFITGTEQLQDDGTAPVLVSTVPEDGSDNASANGKVVLTFDEKVMLNDGAEATLNGQPLTGTASGKTVVFEYKGLAYSTTYTFLLPANSVSDLTGNALNEAVTISFSTRSVPEIAKGLYDYYVKNNDDLVAAIQAANSRSDKTTRYRIFLYNGTYTSPPRTSRSSARAWKGWSSPTTSLPAPPMMDSTAPPASMTASARATCFNCKVPCGTPISRTSP